MSEMSEKVINIFFPESFRSSTKNQDGEGLHKTLLLMAETKITANLSDSYSAEPGGNPIKEISS